MRNHKRLTYTEPYSPLNITKLYQHNQLCYLFSCNLTKLYQHNQLCYLLSNNITKIYQHNQLCYLFSNNITKLYQPNQFCYLFSSNIAKLYQHKQLWYICNKQFFEYMRAELKSTGFQKRPFKKSAQRNYDWLKETLGFCLEP